MEENIRISEDTFLETKARGIISIADPIRQRPDNNIYRKAFKNTMRLNNNNKCLLQSLQHSLIKN